MCLFFLRNSQSYSATCAMGRTIGQKQDEAHKGITVGKDMIG